ncbi:MAG: SAM-dependent methyltransferase [Dongiaceae bacterium]
MTADQGMTADFYYVRYAAELRALQDKVFAEVFENYFGQGGWITTADYDRFFGWLEPAPDSRVLDVASGWGAPALRLARATGCSVIGIDSNPAAVEGANALAREQGMVGRVRFELRDAGRLLDYADRSFDAILCMDALTHLPDRALVMGEWSRLLKPGGRLVFTDQIMTGPISSDEIADRAPGFRMTLVMPGYNERLLGEAGLELVRQEDLSDTLAELAARHCHARERHATALRALEGDDVFQSLSRYRASAEKLAREHRLSHFVFLARARSYGEPGIESENSQSERRASAILMP